MNKKGPKRWKLARKYSYVEGGSKYGGKNFTQEKLDVGSKTM